jgi:hypothetical protein
VGPFLTSAQSYFLLCIFSITIKVNVYIEADINADAHGATWGVFFRTENVQFPKIWLERK